jgi:hypothetical protein
MKGSNTHRIAAVLLGATRTDLARGTEVAA